MEVHLLPKINEVVVFLTREEAAALVKEIDGMWPQESREPKTKALLEALERVA